MWKKCEEKYLEIAKTYWQLVNLERNKRRVEPVSQVTDRVIGRVHTSGIIGLSYTDVFLLGDDTESTPK